MNTKENDFRRANHISEDETVYKTPLRYWVKLQQYANHTLYRAATNDNEYWFKINDELDWKDDKAQAQLDLDQFAAKYNLQKVSYDNH